MVTSNLHIWHMHIYERLESAAVWIQYDEMIFYANLQFHVVIIGYGTTKKFTSILYSMRISHRLISNLSLLNAEKKETFMEDSHEYAEMSKITNTLLTCTFYLLANYRSGAQRTSTTLSILIRYFTLINCYDFFFQCYNSQRWLNRAERNFAQWNEIVCSIQLFVFFFGSVMDNTNICAVTVLWLHFL